MRYIGGDTGTCGNGRWAYFKMYCDYTAITYPPVMGYEGESSCSYTFHFYTAAACPVHQYSSPICYTYTSPDGVKFNIPAYQNKFFSYGKSNYFLNLCRELGAPLAEICGNHSAVCTTDSATNTIASNFGDFSTRKFSALPNFSGVSMKFRNSANVTGCPQGRSFQVNLVCNYTQYNPSDPAFVSGDNCSQIFEIFSAHFCPGPVKETSYDICYPATEADGTLSLDCANGGIITGFPFVAYGNPNVSYVSGSCGMESYGSCNSTSIKLASVIEGSCLNKSSCTVGSSYRTYDSPCAAQTTGTLAIRATCTTFYPAACTCVIGTPCCGTDCQPMSSTTPCRNSTNRCDQTEYCAGTSATCPPDDKGYIDSCGVCNGLNNTCDPCAVGACDFQVSCDFTNNTLSCGKCPLGTVGSGYTSCNTTCGDLRCDPAQGEDCVSCPVDCMISSCGVCGDLSCDEGETCDNCFQDCGSCDTKCKDKCNHGQCQKGKCVCDYPWNGPTCSSNNQDLGNVTINPTQPNLTVVTDLFLISVKSIEEVDSSGTVLRSMDLSNVSFVQNITVDGSNTLFNYSTTLENRALLNVIIWQLEEESTTMTFAGVTTVYPAHTIKLSVVVTSWPFLNLKNTLHVNMNSGASDKVSCVHQNADSQNNLRWFLVVINETSLYGQFLDKAEIDDRIHTISFVLKDEKTISAILPHFWDKASLDPQFSVLLQDKTAKCGSKRNWKLIEILVPTLVGAAILCGVIIVVYPRYQTWRKTRKMKHVGSSVELDSKNNIQI
eukprot:Phypoly_transcript_02574.p1 GENE.Phypoly_transcript_02574~~Phypoly_transcript_02574.p1  ORF type:complete len:882 (+),score=66.12 Phypoly_transcript_02574:322-2646(+)